MSVRKNGDHRNREIVEEEDYSSWWWSAPGVDSQQIPATAQTLDAGIYTYEK